MMPDKKEYMKPLLRSQEIELGVFGDYGEEGDDEQDDDGLPIRITVIENLRLE